MYSCSTVKQLQDRYPELVHLLPNVEKKPTTALVVTREDVKKVLNEHPPQTGEPMK